VEVLSVIERVGLVMDADDERLVVFSVGESGQAKQARDICGGGIAAVLRTKARNNDSVS
jgi:hypothetical protein